MAFSLFARYARAGAHRHQAAAVLLTGGLFGGASLHQKDCNHWLARCDVPPLPRAVVDPIVAAETSKKEIDEEFYHGMFPKRQLWKPRKEYPLWDANWDDAQPTPLEDTNEERRRQRHIRRAGITRHVIMIRHGQYDERDKDDAKRILTPLGREQADLTGRRLKEMMQAIIANSSEEEENDEDTALKPKTPLTPVVVKVIYVSNMTRAKETADIIGEHLPGKVIRAEPDPLLNEGRPSHHIPAGSGKASAHSIAKTDEGHERTEEAFRKYFHRAEFVEEEKVEDEKLEPRSDGATITTATTVSTNASTTVSTTVSTAISPHDKETNATNKHVFEIYVCHANVIRYFTCRALQLPPEAWLRFCNLNCSLTYLTIRPTGSVSCRMFGDIGHLPYDKSTFSMHHGYNW